MPALARKHLVREGEVACYHVWSRCVQRIWLCGEDPVTGTDYSHRKTWIEDLLKYQAKVFAVDVGAYHILSNHKHSVLCTRPDIARTWSAEEIAWRWKMAWPNWEAGAWFREPDDRSIEALLAQGPQHIEKLRGNLSSLSWFLARWKEPIARRVNFEAKTSGHMWAERFGCRELTDDGEVLAGCVYNDLQQVKCGAVESVEQSNNASIQLRFQAWAAQESQEIVNAFQGKKLDEEAYHLPADVVEQMLVDSWLTPFSDESPLLLLRKEQEEIEEPPVTVLTTTADANGDPSNASEAEAPPESKTPPSTPATEPDGCAPDPDRKTYQIHKLQLPKLDDITMRRPLLEISRVHYLDIVRRASDAWKALDLNDPLIDPGAPPRMSDQGSIGRRRASFKQFTAFFRKMGPQLKLPEFALARGDPD